MVLVDAEDDGLLQRVDILQDGLGNQFGTLIGNDLVVEVVGVVDILGGLALDDLVVGGQHQLIQVSADALDPVGGEKAVVDAILERVLIGRMAEIVVGIDVIRALWSGGEAQMHGGGEVLQNSAPGALVIGRAHIRQ
jgi:hypothetical protein